MVACVYPNGTEDVITCPYNMAFATAQLREYASCVFPIENRALLDILSKQQTRVPSFGKHFQDMNNIVGNMLLHLTW